jgi:GNAT superfamily N-acetyltransferase
VGGITIEIDTAYQIRPIRAGRDMLAVLDLIEMGFRDELDPQGWKMLKQMRRLTLSGVLTRAVYNAGDIIGGFVCTKGDEVIGNLSLRAASPRSSRGRMIGNVVVHPDHRGLGIGRALMERSIEAARDQGAQWIGLEVREDNDVAGELYAHLGFRPVGTIEHMLRPQGLTWPHTPHASSAWRKSRPRDRDHWRQLATLMHPYEQRMVLETAAQSFAFGGLERRLNRWLSGRPERAWIHDAADGKARMAIRIQGDRRSKFLVWELLLNPACMLHETDDMVAQCLTGSRRFPTWPVIALVPEHPPLLQSLTGVGFEIHRTLQQMILTL